MRFCDKLPVESGPGEIDGNGFLRLRRVRFGRVGVQQYLGRELPAELGFEPDEVVNVFRPPEEVFASDSLATLEGLPAVSGEHYWRTVEDNKAVGSVAGSIMIDQEIITGGMLITDKETIEDIKRKVLSDISLGYTAKVTKEEGEWNGQQYQAVQRDIKYNHVAILKPGEGRAGSKIKIEDKKTMANETMVTVGTKHGDIEVSQSSRPALQKLMDGCASAEATSQRLGDSNKELETKIQDANAVKEERDKLKAEKEELKGQLAAKDAELQDARNPEKVEAAAAELSEVREVGAAVMGDKLPKGIGADKLRIEIGKHYAAEMNLVVDSAEDKDGFYRGVYSVAAASVKSGGKKEVAGADIFQDRKPNQPQVHPATVNWGYKAKGGEK